MLHAVFEYQGQAVNPSTAFPAISENSRLRFFFVFVLYIAQGVPYGLFFFAIPAWLAINDASTAAVGGYISAASLPWTLKFLHGFFMDRYAFLPMGRRRAWLAGAQLCMFLGLVICAAIGPDSHEVLMLSIFAFAFMLATTIQDVAVDGMAVDLLQENERARANGLMFGGQSVGIAAGTAISGWLIATMGLVTALLVVAAFMLAVLCMVLVLRERPGERLLPWTAGQASSINRSHQVDAWWPLLSQTFRVILRKNSLILILAAILAGASWGFFLGLAPLVATAATGWSDAEYSSISGLGNLISGIAAILVFGILIERIGTRWGLVMATGLFALLCLAMAFNESLWAEHWTMSSFVVIAITLYVMILVGWAATAMRICSPAVAATQFALYMAVANLGTSLAAALLGPIEALGGYPAVFLATAVGLAISGALFFTAADAEKLPVEISPAID